MASDIDPTLEFAQLVMALGRPGSLFLAISTSGKSDVNIRLHPQVVASSPSRLRPRMRRSWIAGE
ncbi:MAG: hypothetical protein ACK49N_02485 [Verrucomicrobiota bacterium]